MDILRNNFSYNVGYNILAIVSCILNLNHLLTLVIDLFVNIMSTKLPVNLETIIKDKTPVEMIHTSYSRSSFLLF